MSERKQPEQNTICDGGTKIIAVSNVSLLLSHGLNSNNNFREVTAQAEQNQTDKKCCRVQLASQPNRLADEKMAGNPEQ